MNIYLILKLVFELNHGNHELNELIKNVGFIFVPGINLDGYRKIEEIYSQTSILSEKIRKNRHADPEFHCDEYRNIIYFK
jgi:hypothetical protein